MFTAQLLTPLDDANAIDAMRPAAKRRVMSRGRTETRTTPIAMIDEEGAYKLVRIKTADGVGVREPRGNGGEEAKGHAGASSQVSPRHSLRRDNAGTVARDAHVARRCVRAAPTADSQRSRPPREEVGAEGRAESSQ